MNVEEDITEALITYRDLIHNIHFIDADNTMVKPNGLLDFSNIIQTLCKIHYNGWIVLATSLKANGNEKQNDDLKRSVEYLNHLIDKFT